MRRASDYVRLLAAGLLGLCALAPVADAAPPAANPPIVAPAPQPAKRPPKSSAPAAQAAPRTSPQAAEIERLARVNGARSWGYQLNGAKIDELAASPYDLLVVDATTGLASGKPFTRADVERLKHKPDGTRRLVVSYLSIGEAEDYRKDYFSDEYMEEDAPDWLMHENKDWKGNRIVNVCADGWQKTMLGDERGRSVYSSIEPSPLYRLVELGFDGVYLDRVDVYEEIGKQCPDAEKRMVDFVVRLAAHARKANPYFLVIQQNAEDLLKHAPLVKAIDAMGKESLFYGWGGGDGSNSARTASDSSVREAIDLLNRAKSAGRPIFVVDYTASRANAETAQRRNRDLGFVPYVGPKELNQLWLPGRNF